MINDAPRLRGDRGEMFWRAAPIGAVMRHSHQASPARRAMSQAQDTAHAPARLSGSDNLKRHEQLLEEMRALEKDKKLVLDRVYRYEFAQPADDGKLYAPDAFYGKIRAAGWEPHEYIFDTKEIGGSTRCWKVGELVLLAKDKNHPLAVVPLVFLRGSGPKAKHRAVLQAQVLHRVFLPASTAVRSTTPASPPGCSTPSPRSPSMPAALHSALTRCASSRTRASAC
jgi:hypothetical protein